MIYVQLVQGQRSSKPIMEFNNYMHHHSSPTFTLRHLSSEGCFDGALVKWVEMDSPEAFSDYARKELQGHFNDAMIIYDSENGKHFLIQELATEFNWGYYSNTDVRGSEASFVVIYDFNSFDYEAFTRAKHHLLIATINNGKR